MSKRIQAEAFPPIMDELELSDLAARYENEIKLSFVEKGDTWGLPKRCDKILGRIRHVEVITVDVPNEDANEKKA